MQADIFLDFTLVKIGIEANPEKCQAIIEMRSPCNVKEAQQLTERLTCISRLLFYTSDKAFHFLPKLKKNEIFECMDEFISRFSKLKAFITLLPISTRLIAIHLYISTYCY